ncbi:MAG: hypothetical protein ABGX00_06165 [Allomuricauda sp.]
MAIYWSDPTIERILLFCGNGTYIVRIDLLKNLSIRYLCWHTNKGLLSPPCLVLDNGRMTRSGTDDEKTEFFFEHEDWTFSVERIVPKDYPVVSHIFLEVCDQDQKKSTWKMEPLSLPKYFDTFN